MYYTCCIAPGAKVDKIDQSGYTWTKVMGRNFYCLFIIVTRHIMIKFFRSSCSRWAKCKPWIMCEKSKSPIQDISCWEKLFVSSLEVGHLLVDWRCPEREFHRKLLPVRHNGHKSTQQWWEVNSWPFDQMKNLVFNDQWWCFIEDHLIQPFGLIYLHMLHINNRTI